MKIILCNLVNPVYFLFAFLRAFSCGFVGEGSYFFTRLPMQYRKPEVRMKIWPSEMAGELRQ